MRKLLTLLLFFPLLAHSGLSDETISAKRNPNETFQQAVERVKKNLPQNKIKTLLLRETPYGKKVPVNELDFKLVPAVASYEELMTLFKVIRDSRFLSTEEDPEFSRRISWLYPDDGCFARAELSVIKLGEEHLTKPAKIFAFGDLKVTTPYSAKGYVSWWYHVSTIVSYMGVNYILDPALNAEAPIPVYEWYDLMGQESNLSGIVCNPNSYDPFDNCYVTSNHSDDSAFEDQQTFLNKEWKRLSSLGFDPILMLGNNPPWMVELMK